MTIYLLFYVLLLSAFLGGLIVEAFRRMIQPEWGSALHVPPLRPPYQCLILAILFLPIALTFRSIYPWASEFAVQTGFRSVYLSPGFFFARAAVYFLIWGWVAWRQSRSANGGAWMLVLILFSGSFAAFDWIMSLEPDWHSTAFGVVYLTGAVLLAFGLHLLSVSSQARSDTLINMNNVLLSLIGAWSYLVFMQFLVIWSGDLPEEASWFVHRFDQGWFLALAVLVTIGQFAIPFPLLLFRELKRQRTFTRVLGGLTFAMQGLFLVWLVVPAR